MESQFFQIRIPSKANVLDPAHLSSVYQQMLSASHFNPDREEAFWFPVTVEHYDASLRDFYDELNRDLPLDDYETLLSRHQRFLEQRQGFQFWPRKQKKKSFYVVDSLTVHLGVATPGVSLLGICPRSIDENFMPVMSRIGAPVADIEMVRRASKITGAAQGALPSMLKLRTDAAAEEEFRYRRASSVILRASHDDRQATWAFTEPWLKAGADTSVQFLCTAHKALPPANRYVVCKAIAAEKSRTVANTSPRRVALPA